MGSILKNEGGGHLRLFLVAIILSTPTILVQGEEPGKGAASFSNDSANTSHNVIPNSMSTWAKNAAEGESLDEWTAPYKMRKGFPYYLAGHDYEDRPVWVIETGKWNFRKVVEKGEKSITIFELYQKQLIHRWTKSIKDAARGEVSVTGMMFISDLEGFSLTQMAHIPTVSYLMKIVREHRDWMMDQVELAILINTNAVAQTMVNLMRPLLGSFMERVETYGTQKSKWQPALLRHIPRSQLPPFYGGTTDFKPIQVYG